MRGWYAFYPKDFMIDTPHLTLEQECLYRKMIDHYYMSGGPLPHDPKLIATILRLNSRLTRRLLPFVENFFEIKDGLMHHKRIDAELEKAKKIQERRAKAGRKGGKANAKQMLDDDGSKSLSKPQPQPQPQPQKDINNNAAATAAVSSAPKKPPVPYAKITELYHEILPELPEIRTLTDTRKRHIKARWQNGLSNLEQWRRYFTHVAESDFLMGRCDPGFGRGKPFQASIDWLIKESNVVKVAEGRYHD